MNEPHNGQSRPAAQERIASRAYEKWRARCAGAEGQLQDWLEAEAELATVEGLTRLLAEGQDRVARLQAERRQAERRLIAEHAVARILAASETFAGAAPRILQAICESLDWDVGAVWVVDPSTDLLRCLEVWHRSDVEILAFERVSSGLRFAPGAGLPGRVLAGGAVIWIPDVTAVADCPRGVSAAGAGLRAAIAFPIRNGAEPLGVLEFFSREVRPPDGSLTGMMASIGSQISQLIERRAAEERLREQQHDRRVGRQIQVGLLPRSVPRPPGFAIAGRSLAANDVGGDCFDFIPLSEGARIGVLVADASGHGIGAALLAGQARAYLRALALTCADVGQLLRLTNTRLTADAASDHFVTALLLGLEPATRSLRYSSAGHVPGYVLGPTGQTRAVLPSTDVPLGIDPRGEFPTSEAVTLEPGDLVLLLTDGIVEATSPSGELFGSERALGIVRRHQHQAPDDILAALFDAASAFCVHDVFDDLTAVVIKCDSDA